MNSTLTDNSMYEFDISRWFYVWIRHWSMILYMKSTLADDSIHEFDIGRWFYIWTPIWSLISTSILFDGLWCKFTIKSKYIVDNKFIFIPYLFYLNNILRSRNFRYHFSISGIFSHNWFLLVFMTVLHFF